MCCECTVLKKVNGDELIRLIISILPVSLGVGSGKLVAVTLDGTSANEACLVNCCYC